MVLSIYVIQKGGDRKVVEETIQTIRETESEADAIVKDAEAKGKELLEKASQEAKKQKEEHLSGVEAKAKTDLESARAQGEKTQAEAEITAAKEVDALKTMALQKKKEAVNLVIEQLI